MKKFFINLIIIVLIALGFSAAILLDSQEFFVAAGKNLLGYLKSFLDVDVALGSIRKIIALGIGGVSLLLTIILLIVELVKGKRKYGTVAFLALVFMLMVTYHYRSYYITFAKNLFDLQLPYLIFMVSNTALVVYLLVLVLVNMFTKPKEKEVISSEEASEVAIEEVTSSDVSNEESVSESSETKQEETSEVTSEEVKEEVKEEEVKKEEEVIRVVPPIHRREPIHPENVVTEVKKIELEAFETSEVELTGYTYVIGKGWLSFFNRMKRNESFTNHLWEKTLEMYKNDAAINPKLVDIFKPFEYSDPDHIKVVFVNKQPSTTLREEGLAFSSLEVATKSKTFEALYEEAMRDKKVRARRYDSGKLTSWAKEGIFLLNSHLTNSKGQSKKHEALGYEEFTDNALVELNRNQNPKVFVLIGSYAITKQELITNSKHKVITFSSLAKIKESNLFSNINDFLVANGQEPVDFSLGKIRK